MNSSANSDGHSARGRYSSGKDGSSGNLHRHPASAHFFYLQHHRACGVVWQSSGKGNAQANTIIGATETRREIGAVCRGIWNLSQRGEWRAVCQGCILGAAADTPRRFPTLFSACPSDRSSLTSSSRCEPSDRRWKSVLLRRFNSLKYLELRHAHQITQFVYRS